MAVTASESHFDAQARTWDESPMRLALSAAVAAGVWDALRPAADAHLLEFGCGTGLVGLRLADRIGHLTAADRSGAMLEVLAGKASDLGFSNVRCVRVDGDTPAIPGIPFDGIFASMVLHHVRDIPALLQLFGSWCTPGGRVAIADLDAEDGTFHTDASVTEHNGLDRDDLRRRFEAAGFRVESVRTVHVIRRGEGPDGPREYPVFLMVARNAGS